MCETEAAETQEVEAKIGLCLVPSTVRSCRRPGHGLIAWPPATSTAKWKTALTAFRRVAFPVPLGRLLEGPRLQEPPSS